MVRRKRYEIARDYDAQLLIMVRFALLNDIYSRKRRPRPSTTRQQPFLDRLDLQRQMLRADPALRQAAGDEPQARLPGTRVHVAQFLLLAKAPDGADALFHGFAQHLSHPLFLPLLAAPDHDP